MDNETINWIKLNMPYEIGPVRFKRLIEHFGSVENVLSANVSELREVEDISKDASEKIYKSLKNVDIAKELKLIETNNVEVVKIIDDKYPKNLKTIYDPPQVIYIRGEFKIQDNFSVSIVGTRRATVYGRQVCEKISEELAELGITVISGLARGIDTIAHSKAIDKEGRTIAILGNGLAHHYPPENKKLEEKIIESGALISEFPMTVIPDKQNFPRRNRIISGISLGSVIVEADEKSGALITANCALEQGRDVFAVPGNIFSKYSKGPHGLIKQGAKLVESAKDIIEEIEPLREIFKELPSSKKKTTEKSFELFPEEKVVYDILDFEPSNIDTICIKSSFPVYKISSLLLNLEIKGLIEELPGKTFIKRRI